MLFRSSVHPALLLLPPLLNTARTEPATRKAPSGAPGGRMPGPSQSPGTAGRCSHGAGAGAGAGTETQTAQPCRGGRSARHAEAGEDPRQRAQRRAHTSTPVTRAHRRSLCEDVAPGAHGKQAAGARQPHQAGADPRPPQGAQRPHGSGHATSRGPSQGTADAPAMRPPDPRLPALGPGPEHSPPALGWGGQEPRCTEGHRPAGKQPALCPL